MAIFFLQTFCSKIKLPDEFVYYFGLFLMKTHEDGSEECVSNLKFISFVSVCLCVCLLLSLCVCLSSFVSVCVCLLK